MNFKIESVVPRARSTLSLPGALSAACLFAGIGGSFASMFFSGAPLTVPLCTGLGAILLSWLLRKQRRAPAILCALLLAAMVPGLMWFGLTDGLLTVINRVSVVLGAHLGRNLARYAADGTGEIFACSLMSGLAALGCVWIVRARSRLIAALFALCAAAPDVLLGLSASPVWIGLMFAGLILLCLPEMLLLCDSRAGFAVWLTAALAVCITFCFSSALLARTEIPQVRRLRETLLARIETARFGESLDGMPAGDFSALDACELSGESMLEITMSEPESLYLRGFVGSEYHADGWKAASNVSLSDGADLFYWLHRAGFYGQTQLARAAMLLDSEVTAEDAVEITVRHTGAGRKYVYAPYELTGSDLLDPDAVGDVRLGARSLTGADSYAFVSAPNQVKRYTALLSMLKEAEKGAASESLSEYLVNESHYNAFVYDHFLSLPDETAELLTGLLGKPEFSGERHLDYGEAKQRILDYLDENVTYRETTPPRLEGTDFLNEFLKINASGYDVHYATAATLMMRHFGIPARYVEGYLITPSDAESAESGVPFTLTGERAHAWCEIYQDGVGWVPFEVTPKYMDLMERSDVVRTAADSGDETQPETQEHPPEESSQDMEEDFYDDLEDEEDPDDNPLPLDNLLLAALSLMALALLALLLFWLSVRLSLMRLNHSLRLKNRRLAVQNLYAHLFSLMQEIYGWHDCIAPSGFIETVRADQGEDAAIKYRRIVEICERAAFSDHKVKESDYRLVYAFVRKTRQLLKNRSGRGRRLKLRYLRRLI